jgi:hypothetical protein
MIRAASAAVLSLAAAAGAQLHGGDIVLDIDNNQLVTKAVDPSTGLPNPGQRVFPGAFGGAVPNWTNDPGFDSLSGTFSPGQQIGFDILKALRAWTGSDFSRIPDERIEIRRGGLLATTPTSDVRTDGFIIGEANLGGRFHHHIGFTLTDPAEPGVYLLELAVWTPAGSPEESEPFWIVFNQNQPPSVFNEALDWAAANLPGSACYADCNGDGALDFFDFLCFQNAFLAGDPYADCNADGVLDFFDFLCFQNEFLAGCP